MIGVGIRLVQRPPSAAEIFKQVNFGTAVGITKTTKRAQAAVKDALRGNFTIRNKWPDIGPYAIKVKTATKTDTAGEIYTNADWLVAHEKGGTKTARGGRVAIPTDKVRLSKRGIIQRNQRPRNLKNTFVMQTKNGPVLAQRISRGKNKGIKILYGLEKSVRIKRVSVFYEPIDNIVRRFLNSDIRDGVSFALKTMRK
jgi:hypothetical protein